MYLMFMCIAWIFGIAIGSYTNVSFAILFACVLPLAVVPFLRQHRASLIFASICIVSCMGGILHMQSGIDQINSEKLQQYNDSSVTVIEGIIASDPERRDTSISFHFSAHFITAEDTRIPINGKAMVFAGKYPEYRYGDQIRIRGMPVTPLNNSEFDYRGYLEEKGIRSIISYPAITPVKRDQGNPALTAVYTLRRGLSESLSKALPEPQNALAQGILLGLRSTIPQELKDAFTRTGTTHILAISGHNLSIFIGICLAIGIWIFGRRHRIYIWLALAITWLYTLISGMSPPVIRSALMISIFLTAELLGRQRHSMTALLFAAAVMTVFQPSVLGDVSFQLSFMAMSGLIIISPSLISRGRSSSDKLVRSRGFIRSTLYLCTDSTAVTIAALITTWPLIAYYFGTFSLVAIPATFFASLALPGIIIASAITGIAGLALPLLSMCSGWITWAIISFFMLIIQGFDALPFTCVSIHPHAWHIWLYYAAVAIIVKALHNSDKTARTTLQALTMIRSGASHLSQRVNVIPKRRVLLPAASALILLWSAILTTQDGKLHVSFLDVGQGDAILIQMPGRQNILIDGGPSPQKLKTELSKKLSFWDRDIDIVFLTQPHADHVTGAVDILKNYHVNKVIEAPQAASRSAIYSEWLETVEDNQILRQIVDSDYAIEFGSGIMMEILHPPNTPFTNANADAHNLVMRLSWKDVSFLFTADIGSDIEQYLVNQRAAVRSTELKEAHHGSSTSSSDIFISTVRPSAAVISSGEGNKFGHPAPEILDRFHNLVGHDNTFITANHGTIEFITDGTSLRVRCDRAAVQTSDNH